MRSLVMVLLIVVFMSVSLVSAVPDQKAGPLSDYTDNVKVLEFPIDTEEGKIVSLPYVVVEQSNAKVKNLDNGTVINHTLNPGNKAIHIAKKEDKENLDYISSIIEDITNIIFPDATSKKIDNARIDMEDGSFIVIRSGIL